MILGGKMEDVNYIGPLIIYKNAGGYNKFVNYINDRISDMVIDIKFSSDGTKFAV
jgi:hypothetical protein